MEAFVENKFSCCLSKYDANYASPSTKDCKSGFEADFLLRKNTKAVFQNL